LRTLHEHGTRFRERRNVLSFSLGGALEPRSSAVEFGVAAGEYEGAVSVPRRVLQILFPEKPTPERCLGAYRLRRTRLERIAERKLRRRQLTDDGNVEITGRDLRERESRAHSVGTEIALMLAAFQRFRPTLLQALCLGTNFHATKHLTL
jgi:Protein of unknown function (DUF1488)